MTDSTGASGFLPTVTFTSPNTSFTSAQRIAQLAALGITGFYEADFADNITTISASAFQNDSRVVVATINKVTSIGDTAFNLCTSLRAITLDTAVDANGRYLLTSIGLSVFSGCYSLRNLHIPDTVKIIPGGICYACTSLEVAVIGYGWDRTGNTYNTNGTIGSYAFANCHKLSYFVVPETISSIGDYAFENDVSLSLVYILGTPTASSNAFSGAMNSSSAIYYYNTTSNISSFFPALATKRAYTEYTISATGALTSATVTSTIPATTYWKGKIAASVTSLAQSCFEGSSAGIGTLYPYMIGHSLPPNLTTIGYGAFLNTDGTSGYSCIVGAYYIPNSVTTFGIINATSNAFGGLNSTLRDTSTTRQIVFQSGPNTTAFSGKTCKLTPAKAIILPNVTSFGSECFIEAPYVQLYSFFQKNAYTATTRLDGPTEDTGKNAFTWNFSLGGGYTHYLYIPKQITRMSQELFRGLRDKIYVTAYHNSISTAGVTAATGLGFGYFSYTAADGTVGDRFTGTAPTLNIIYNFYDAAGLTSFGGTSIANATNFLIHVLYPSGVKTIGRRFDAYTMLKSVNIPDTVTDICANAFINCTGLNNVYISPNSNLTVLNVNAFNACSSLTSFFIPNSLRYIYEAAFAYCTSLATVTYGNNPGLKFIGPYAFYDATKALTSIFIPSSVIYIGTQAFITSVETNVNILNTVTFGAGSRLRSITAYCFGGAGDRVNRAAAYLFDLVLPSTLRYMGGNSTNDARSTQNAFRYNHSANFVFPSSLTFLPFACLFVDGAATDISNVYVPISITATVGPRTHNGYRDNTQSIGGVGGYIIGTSNVGSIIYLPSQLSGITSTGEATGGSHPFPSTNRTRSFYRTVSYTTNPLLTLTLSSGNPTSTTSDTGTSQIHADIKEGVTVIGGGTLNITNAAGNGSLNLISVNIPSTVTTISANAFNGCSAMAYVTFSENSKLTTIGNSAFSGCSMIHDIQLPDTLTTIGTNAFAGCYNLASISIPYNVTSIGAGAFNVNSSTSTTDIVRKGGYVAYKLGSDIEGEGVSDYSGYSVSISSDGKILAIGAVYNDAGGGDAGHVRIYKYQTIPVTDTTWANYTVNSFSNTGTSPFNKPIVINGGDVLPVSGKYYWVQLGSDINGETGYAGWSVSLSSDGTTVAIGALVNGGAGTDAGQVRVYKYQTVTDASWNSYTINSFTYNGTAPTNKPIIANGGDANPVSGKSYWVQLGVDIDGETINSQSGNSVSLSSNGQILAIGARYDDLNSATNSGSVRVYQYNSGTGTWSKLGSTITAGSAADEFGYSVSLNDAGTVVAIGARYAANGAVLNAGIVRVYAYSGSAWTQRGSNILGNAFWDVFGESVSLSSDGTILAIGAIGGDVGATDSGQVRVFKWNGSSWIQLGQNINGASQWDHLGNSVSLNGDGTILAVGARYSDTTSTLTDTGMVRIYKFFNGTWQKLGQDIRGDFINDLAGYSVSLSKDGTTVAIGANGNDGNGWDSGSVRVYQISNFTVRLHQRLYDTISDSFSTYFPGISPDSVQIVPALTLTNTLNPARLTISQINNIYIRYRQSQLGCTKITVSASSGGILQLSDVTSALSGTTGLVHLEISNNVTSIAGAVCLNNTRIYSVAISKTVTTIGTSVFNECTNLTYLSFHPDSVCTTIGDSAFYRTNIIDLALPDSLTTIVAYAFFQSPSLTSVCIPKNVTAIGANTFNGCPKLTSVALPASLTAYANVTYFSTNGINTTGITFTYYSASSAISHFKLSDYSMPTGIVQTVIDSAVKYIDHRAYAYYPEITLYAVTTNKQTQTPGPYSYTANNVQFPIMPAAFWLNGGTVIANSMFPIYRSMPDLNIFSLSSTASNWLDDQDDFYILMPGYSICIYNNLYDEDNLFTDSPVYNYYDNEFGTVPLNISPPASVINKTSSILIMSNGRILSKYFAS
jgi:hypothetical protein